MRNTTTATIYRIEEYAREKGDQITLITAKTPLDGGETQYVGRAIGEVKGPQGQTGRIPFAFPIEAESIEDAFENYNDAKTRAWPEAVEQFQQQMYNESKKIQVARAVTAADAKLRGGNGRGIRISK